MGQQDKEAKPTHGQQAEHANAKASEAKENKGQAKGKGNDKANNKANNGKGKDPGSNGNAGKADGSHPGQGLANRSERANEVAQNTCKNKHLLHLCDADDDGVPDVEEGDGGDGGTIDPGTGDGGLDTTPPTSEVIKVSMGEQLFYYHPDHLGSTGYVTRENGEVHEHIQYFPFGETWVQQGGNTEKSPYLFTAKELDEETGLYYFGARYYDPRTSVWQSADPVIEKYLDGAVNGVYESSNLAFYTYSRNNPVILKDPDGNMAPVAPVPPFAPGFPIAGGGQYSSGGYQPGSGVQGGTPPFISRDIDAKIGGYVDAWTSGVKVITTLANPMFISESLMMMRDSKELAGNLEQAGDTRPKGSAAHHIVPSRHRRGAEARDILDGFGIDVNSADNGVFLPHSKDSEAKGAYHPSLHTNKYIDKVTERLRGTENKAEAIETLRDIRDQLLNDSFDD